MKTRTGKIARLPRLIRNELNQRLGDGEEGKKLVGWLNRLPEVRAVMAESFEGKPVTEQNLSEWKAGGFAEWAGRQEVFGAGPGTGGGCGGFAVGGREGASVVLGAFVHGAGDAVCQGVAGVEGGGERGNDEAVAVVAWVEP